MTINNQQIDSENTSRAEAQILLLNLCENGFSGNIGELALVLGRDEEEITGMLEGEADIDEDLLMKVRGIARERDIEIDFNAQNGKNSQT